MATEEKKDYPTVVQTPPEYSTVAPAKHVRKSTVVLSVYATAVTALLLTLAIFGAIMYSNALRDCATEDQDVTPQEPRTVQRDMVEFDDNGKKVTEESELDEQKELEIIRLAKIGEETDGATVVLDYKRRLTGMYLPEAGECYIIGGVNHDLRSPFREIGYDDGKDKKPDEKVIEYSLQKADDFPMVDTDILPEPLQDTCENKDAYWLERTTERVINGTLARTRRCIRVRRCWRICCWWRCRRRCTICAYVNLFC